MLWTTFTLPHRSAYAAPIAAGPALCRVDLPPCDCGAEYGVIVTDGLPPLQEAVDGHQRSARAPQTSLRVDSRTLPDGLDPRFEVMASDGVLTSSDISVRGLEVPMKPPRVSIATPAARVQFTADRPITFVGARLPIFRTGRCPLLRWCGGPRSTALSAGGLRSRRP